MAGQRHVWRGGDQAGVEGGGGGLLLGLGQEQHVVGLNILLEIGDGGHVTRHVTRHVARHVTRHVTRLLGAVTRGVYQGGPLAGPRD